MGRRSSCSREARREGPPKAPVAFDPRMAADIEPTDPGYANRAPMHFRAPWRARSNDQAGRPAAGRAVERMRLVLQAYEQRAQRRAALHAWLAARVALSGRT